MSRWSELPAALDPRVRQLVVQLRRLKDHSGLSLAALADKTGYSRSSWERYLNGRHLPPSSAVRELARVGGTDATRLLALHEVAAVAWRSTQPADADGEADADEEANADADGEANGDAEADADADAARTTPGLATGVPPEPPPHRSDDSRTSRASRTSHSRALAYTAVGVAVLALVAAVLLTLLPGGGGGTDAAPEQNPLITAHKGAFPTKDAGPTAYRCEVRRHNGRTYAGHSVTRQQVLDQKSAGWEVVEAQCLARNAGFSPGRVDGLYGDQTQEAIHRLQKKAGLPADGVVGPETWKALRK